MNKKGIIIGLILAIALSGGIIYRFTHLKSGGAEHTEKSEVGQKEETVSGYDGGKEIKEKKEGSEGREEHGEPGSVKMTAEVQNENGVVIAAAQKQQLGGVISATGKIVVNADRVNHVSSRIPGKIVNVMASLGDSVSAGQALVTLDSIELGEALNRYNQSKTKLALAQSNMDRVQNLVEKKIAARKDLLQAATDFKTAQTELHTDEDRLSMYGILLSSLTRGNLERPLLTVRAPIDGVITEKQAVVGELSDPSKSLCIVADLSTAWVLVDINENDLAMVHKGQGAIVTVGAFPDLKLKGHIAYIADLVNETTRTVKARVEVANPDRKLKPEMFAAVELELQSDMPPVLAVPEEALQELEGKKVLFVTENGTEFAPRKVELGRASGGMTEVLSGIGESDRYAIKGSFLLKSELKKSEFGEG